MLEKKLYTDQKDIKEDVATLLVSAFPEDERPPVPYFFKSLERKGNKIYTYAKFTIIEKINEKLENKEDTKDLENLEDTKSEENTENTKSQNFKNKITSKHLTNLDNFIQQCLDKFKFIDPKQEFYDAFLSMNDDFIYIEPKLIPIVPGDDPAVINKVSEFSEDNF